jgi:diacylglycerol kinase (ATP)
VISHVTVGPDQSGLRARQRPHAAERAIASWQRRASDTVEIVGQDGAHARELLRRCARPGTVTVAVTGGDGVIALALQELAGGRVPLAIVPTGTGNDHARAFGILRQPGAAADLLLDGHLPDRRSGPIDGRPATSKWFGTVVATGFDALVGDRANRMRWPRGRMRYNVAMIAELSRLRLLPFRLSFDDGPTEDVN